MFYLVHSLQSHHNWTKGKRTFQPFPISADESQIYLKVAQQDIPGFKIEIKSHHMLVVESTQHERPKRTSSML